MTDWAAQPAKMLRKEVERDALIEDEPPQVCTACGAVVHVGLSCMQATLKPTDEAHYWSRRPGDTHAHTVYVTILEISDDHKVCRVRDRRIDHPAPIRLVDTKRLSKGWHS